MLIVNIILIGWFILLVILLQSTSGAEPCDDGCPTDSGDMFLFPYPDGSRIVSWSTAHDLCRQHNMTLPTIRSPCEQYMFSSYLQSVGAYEYDIWLGGRTEANHEWKWLNGSQPTNTSFGKSIYILRYLLIRFYCVCFISFVKTLIVSKSVYRVGHTKSNP